MSGPPPQPTNLRILRGNPGKRPINDAEPKPAKAKLTPPRWLPQGKPRAYWREHAPMLSQTGLLTEADRLSLAILCNEQHVYLSTEDEVIKYKALNAILRLSDRFGMNPAYRSKLKVEAEAEVDGLEKMMSGS